MKLKDGTYYGPKGEIIYVQATRRANFTSWMYRLDGCEFWYDVTDDIKTNLLFWWTKS